MPFRCVIEGCDSLPVPRKVSLLKFPDDLDLKRRWIAFVNKTTQRNWSECSSSSRICSKHFLQSDFINYQKFAMGYTRYLILKKNAFPSIYFERETENGSTSSLPLEMDECISMATTGDVFFPEQLHDHNYFKIPEAMPTCQSPVQVSIQGMSVSEHF